MLTAWQVETLGRGGRSAMSGSVRVPRGSLPGLLWRIALFNILANAEGSAYLLMASQLDRCPRCRDHSLAASFKKFSSFWLS